MKKIVIKTNRPEPDRSLLASLNTLFPECEIQIVFKEVGTFDKLRHVGGQAYIPNVSTQETTTKGVLEVLEQVDITR